MKKQLVEVATIMNDGGWRTLRELSIRHGSIPEASASARLREMRRYGWIIERRRAVLPGVPATARVYAYRARRGVKRG